MLEFKQWLAEYGLLNRPLQNLQSDLTKISRNRLGAALPNGSSISSIARNRLGAGMPDEYDVMPYRNGMKAEIKENHVVVNVKYPYDPSNFESLNKMIQKARLKALADPLIKKTLEDAKASWYISSRRTGIKDFKENGQNYKLFTFYFKIGVRPNVKPLSNEPTPPPNLPPENSTN